MMYKGVKYSISLEGIYMGDILKYSWEVLYWYSFDNFRYIYGISAEKFIYIYDIETNKHKYSYLGVYRCFDWYRFCGGTFMAVKDYILYIFSDTLVYSYKAPFNITRTLGNIYEVLCLECRSNNGENYIVFPFGSTNIFRGDMAFIYYRKNSERYIGVFEFESQIYSLFTQEGQLLISIAYKYFDKNLQIITLDNGTFVDLCLEEFKCGTKT